MRAHLLQIDARLPGGTTVPVRASSVSDSLVCHLIGEQWDPVIMQLPVLRYDFFGGAFQNAVTVPQAEFVLTLDALVMVPTDLFTALRFGSARLRIWSGEVGQPFHEYRLRFSGKISGEPEIADGLASFSARADDAWMDVPLLATYAGTGGLEGPEDLTGTVKPLVLGDCRFVPGVLIDPVDSVYQVSAYGPVQAIGAAFDRLNSLGASSGDHANLAALLAATIPNGSWATCLAQGLVRLGAPADGKPCFHVAGDAAGSLGYVTRAGAMIGRVIELAGGSCDSATLTQLDADRPWDQARMLREQTTARQFIQEMADSVAAVAGISWTGVFFVGAYRFGATSIELDAAGTTVPQVAGVSQEALDPPYWRLATNAALTWSVHDLSEIASDYTPRGLYSAARVYRIDDLVSAADGRSFVYVNATPAAGNAPPTAPATSNSWWSLWNAATVGAPAGTTVAGRDAEDVADTIAAGGGVASGTTVAGRDSDTLAGAVNADGTISTEAVVTDSVVDGAITTRARAFTAGSVALSSGGYTWYESQRITVTVSAEGEEVDVESELRWSLTDNCRVKERLKRGSTVLTTTPDYALNNGDNPRGGFGYTDDPGPGTYDYIHEVAANDAGDASASLRRMRAMGPIR